MKPLTYFIFTITTGVVVVFATVALVKHSPVQAEAPVKLPPPDDLTIHLRDDVVVRVIEYKGHRFAVAGSYYGLGICEVTDASKVQPEKP